jgi:hypothetical protein
VTTNVTKATFLQGYDEYAASLGELDRAKSQHQALCKSLKGRGLSLDELKESYKLHRMDTERREAKFANLSRYMLWLGKPIGYQSDLELDTELVNADDIEAVEKHALAEAYQAGYVSGKTGAGMAFCAFEPGTEAHQQYSLGVEVGTKLYVPKKQKESKPARGRGRPRKEADKGNVHVGDSSERVVNFPSGAAAQ